MMLSLPSSTSALTLTLTSTKLLRDYLLVCMLAAIEERLVPGMIDWPWRSVQTLATEALHSEWLWLILGWESFLCSISLRHFSNPISVLYLTNLLWEPSTITCQKCREKKNWTGFQSHNCTTTRVLAKPALGTQYVKKMQRENPPTFLPQLCLLTK